MMNAAPVICIRLWSPHHFHHQPAQDTARSNKPKLQPRHMGIEKTNLPLLPSSSSSSASPTPPPPPKRSWTLSVTVNDGEAQRVLLQDPFAEKEYQSIFEKYLLHLENPHLLLTAPRETDDLDVLDAEDRINKYTTNLFFQLDKRLRLRENGTLDCQVYVVEDYGAAGSASGIHCIAWELLESIQKPRMRITRVTNFPHPSSIPPPLRATQRLSSVQNDPSASFRVLLVVARDLSRSGADRDLDPDLAQYPLMSVQKKLKSRMLLEVVRPGSCEELEAHLEHRATHHKVYFHLVHFDLHGRLRRDENGNTVPWLLFSKKHDVAVDQSHNSPGTHLAKAESIAKMLADYKVENVVLNACLSAYNRKHSETNLAQIFLRHGIYNVSAMWYLVHWQTVATYLQTFYNELLINNAEFRMAAQKGREAIRKKPTMRTNREHKDFFICVNYTRDALPMDSASGDERSPSISEQSHESSTSNSSLKGIWKKPPTPRLGDNLRDNLIFQMEEPMRMKLHLLELEYKLTTFRVVYASDLRRADSKMPNAIDGMIAMWLATNLVDEVYFYKAKDLAKKRLMSDTLPHSEKKTRANSGGYLQMLFPRPIKSLCQTLHVIRDIDPVLDPGHQASTVDNQRAEVRRANIEYNLVTLAERLHRTRDSYLLFIGSQDAQWWRMHLGHLNGDWWLHMPWNITVHSRYNREMKIPGDGGRRSLTPSPLGIRF